MRTRGLVLAMALALLAPGAAPLAEAAEASAPAGAHVHATTLESLARWVPRRGATWQWQLAGTIDLTVKAHIYDLDVDETPRSLVRQLHDRGRRVICYIDVGTWESYRDDADQFPDDLLGNEVDGWPDERWLDIRAIDRLAPILGARLDRCARKGFDAVEPDWLNHYEEDTGFPITREDSVRFARWVAEEAHARGLSIAQKNTPGLTADLADHFDFAITEDCARWDECGEYRPYLRRGAAVLDAEYELPRSEFCPVTEPLGISAIRKHLALGAWRRVCP